MEKFKFKKQYGQNFLNNEEILENISSAFDLKKCTKIIEIGPGAGALTKKLVKKDKPVIAFEIDTELKEKLSKLNYENLTVIFNDFLNINLKDYITETDKISVVANIPYYITTPIITKFIDEQIIPEEMVLMVQKEVGLRLSANPGTRDYGAITVLLNYFFDIEYLFTVDRENFYPVPNVDSAIIKLIKKDNIDLKNYTKFKELVYEAFKHKRKNLKNNLNNYNLEEIEKVLNKYNFTLSNRAEELDYKIFVEIANVL